MPDINNLQLYNSLMEKGIEDKLFFINKLPCDSFIIVDYGCANGALLSKLVTLFPKAEFIGYDISEEQLVLARKNCPQASFYSSWKDVKTQLDATDKYRVLLLSSVLHEIYSYFSSKELKRFKRAISKFDCVIIRDMCISHHTCFKSTPKCYVDSIKEKAITLLNGENQLKSFEKVWGSINVYGNFIHYLLKYRYLVNWDREVQENYLPLNVDAVIELFQKHGFVIDYFERFRIPFLDKCIFKDFGIKLNEYTHIKAIFSKC